MKKILLLLVALLATTTVWAADFITDVMVIGGSKSEVNSLKNTYTSQGWTVIDQDLNAGAGSSSDYIYLLYKAASNSGRDAGAFITGFYISNASGTAPDNVTHDGHTYTLVSCDGSDYFKDTKGDLNSHCGASSAYIHLYYTKDNAENYSSTAVNSITFDATQSGAVGVNGGSTGYDLNTGCGSSSDYIYMHASTAAKGWVISMNSAQTQCTITGYQGTKSNKTSITIPKYIDGAQVTGFSGSVFSGFSNLETMIFYEDTQVSEMPSMQGCSKFKNIKTGSENNKTPASMTRISASAFLGTAIENVTLTSVTSVGANAFAGSTTLNSVVFNKSNVTIGDGAFSYVVRAGGAMCQVTFPGSINAWSPSKYMYSPSLVVNGGSGDVTWSCGWCGGGSSSSYNRLYWTLDAAGQLKIDCADSNWSNHPSDQVITTHNWNKNKVKSLTLEHVYSIDQNEFQGTLYTNLVTLDVKSGVTSIGNNAFNGCNLSSVVFYQSNVFIGTGAFSDIGSNCQITYPGSMNDWTPSAYMYSPNLVVNGGSDSNTWNCGGCGGNSSSNNNLYWTLDAKGNLKIDCADNSWSTHPDKQIITTHNWNKAKVEKLTLEHVYSIAQFEFQNFYSNLVIVDMKSGVTSIGNYAFNNCYKLEKVYLPSCLESIGENAFRNCELLTDLYFDGFEEQWNNVTKATNWNNFVSDNFTEHWHCTVTFNANGHGTAPDPQNIEWSNQGKATEPTAPTANGYNFRGWHTNATCDNQWNFNNIVTGDMTLYAKWEHVIVNVPGDVDGDGEVTTVDITAIYNYLLNSDETFIDTSDVDGDGFITTGDITFIYNILLGNKK